MTPSFPTRRASDLSLDGGPVVPIWGGARSKGMPNYQVTAPDCRKYRVTAPEGATQEQALAYAQQNYRQAQQPPASGPREKYQQSDGTRLHKIELALRAADAAGTVEDARRLARP